VGIRLGCFAENLALGSPRRQVVELVSNKTQRKDHDNYHVVTVPWPKGIDDDTFTKITDLALMPVEPPPAMMAEEGDDDEAVIYDYLD